MQVGKLELVRVPEQVLELELEQALAFIINKIKK
jgi:hypothetical protein